MHSLSAFKIVQVSASHSHFLALSDNGDIYSWVCCTSSNSVGRLSDVRTFKGTCNYGELGHGENVERTDPRLVRRLKGKGIVSIHAGDSLVAS
jgi:alpha-tubulin suppressor-like RCC1 family protein